MCCCFCFLSGFSTHGIHEYPEVSTRRLGLEVRQLAKVEKEIHRDSNGKIYSGGPLVCVSIIEVEPGFLLTRTWIGLLTRTWDLVLHSHKIGRYDCDHA